MAKRPKQLPPRLPYQSRVPDLAAAAERAAANTPVQPGQPSWSLGYRRARALRRVLGLGEERRFPRFRALAEALGASTSYRAAPSVDGIGLLRSHGGGDAHLHLRKTSGAATSDLFTFTRGVADVVCFPDAQAAPVNRLQDAHRQAAGRAFAAEFLAPVNEVLSMHADGRDTTSIAGEFAVSLTVVERQLENAQRIEAARG